MKLYKAMEYTVYGNVKKPARMPSDPDPPKRIFTKFEFFSTKEY